jgi:hypothetical protein
MPELQDLIKVRKRFYDDFEFWAARACKIRTKEGEIKPLVLNAVQRRFLTVIDEQMRTTGKVRIIVLKARQQGMSTVISAWMYWWLSQHKAQRGAVVTHKSDSTNALFQMYRRIHKHTPEALRPSTEYSSKKELSFDKLDTGLTVATAGGEGIARGETITHAHRSEVAFWPTNGAKENMNALDQSIPNTPGTADFIESTANGFNLFHTLWTGAVEGTNGYVAFFSPWFETPEYREPAPEGFERTYEEMEIAERFNLDNDQLQWRRIKIGKVGRELFMQEYPATPEEAFLASGRPVFDPNHINPILEAAPAPIRRMTVEQRYDDKLKKLVDHVVEHGVGELHVYKEKDPAQVYTIGADVAMGVRSGDYSCAQVLDGDKQQVAVWHGHIHPDEFARILAALGYYYNAALIAPERNAHGLLTCIRLWKDLQYPQVFLDVTEGQIADRDSINVGFLTNVKTKPLIIDRLRAAVRDGDIKLCDAPTLREMQTFIVTESGAMEAEEGKFDDRVMALAIANHVHVRRYKPIEVTDDYYVEVA